MYINEQLKQPLELFLQLKQLTSLISYMVFLISWKPYWKYSISAAKEKKTAAFLVKLKQTIILRLSLGLSCYVSIKLWNEKSDLKLVYKKNNIHYMPSFLHIQGNLRPWSKTSNFTSS